MIAGKALLMLTAKGREELKSRSFRLDPMGRNILFLIDRGNNTSDALVERAVFPRTALLDRILQLVAAHFIEVDPLGANGPPSRSAGTLPGSTSEGLRLKAGISLSQARFALCDFCLDHFGTRSQKLVEAINLCDTLSALQQALDQIRDEVRQNPGARFPELVACVDSINDSAS